MTQVNRGHLAGLELALESLGSYCAGSKADAECVLSPLIVQASAAPEQEPIAYMKVDSPLKGFTEFFKHEAWCEEAELSTQCIPLYTHADPSEVDRLRDENERLRAVYTDQQDKRIAMQIERDDLSQKLAEAQASIQLAATLLRDSKANLNQSGRLAKEIREFIGGYEKSKRLSATAQPADGVKS